MALCREVDLVHGKRSPPSYSFITLILHHKSILNKVDAPHLNSSDD